MFLPCRLITSGPSPPLTLGRAFLIVDCIPLIVKRIIVIVHCVVIIVRFIILIFVMECPSPAYS